MLFKYSTVYSMFSKKNNMYTWSCMEIVSRSTNVIPKNADPKKEAPEPTHNERWGGWPSLGLNARFHPKTGGDFSGGNGTPAFFLREIYGLVKFGCNLARSMVLHWHLPRGANEKPQGMVKTDTFLATIKGTQTGRSK